MIKSVAQKLNRVEEFLKSHKLIQSYLRLNMRDRRAVFWLGIFMAFVIIYFGIWQPLYNFHINADNNYRNILIDQKMLLTYQRSGVRTLPGSEGMTLLSIVTDTARKHNITLNNIEPENDNIVSVSVENVPFNQALSWLSEISGQYNSQVSGATIQKQIDEGFVSLKATFSRD